MQGGEGRLARIATLAAGCLVLAGCSANKMGSTVDPRYGVSSSPRVVEYGQPVPKGGGVYKLGPAYTVGGRTYVPREDADYRNEGVASWYGMDFHGRLTANGEVYDMDSISAAHPILPMPSYARVTNLANQKSLIVRINDRGPYAADREIDLSSKAADLLGFRGRGIARVRVEYVGRAPIEGTDDRLLEASLRQGVPAPLPPGVMLASSSKSFVPFSSRPPGLVPVPGDVPIPGERPFDLGDGPGPQASARASSRVASRPAPRSLADVAPALSTAMSAYAPVSYDGPAALASGRGLY